MISRRLAALALAGMVVSPGASWAQDAPAQTFTLDGDWALDAGDDYCRLAANFTNGREAISFALERNRAENSARLVLVGNAIRPFRGADTIGYAFLPDGEARGARYLRSQTPDRRAYFNLGTIVFGPDPFAQAAAGGAPPAPPPMPAAEEGQAPAAFVIPPYDRAAELTYAAGIRGIALTTGLREPIRIETGSLRAPVEALQACADDLLRVWGLDYKRHQTMSRRAAPAGPAFEWIPGNVLGFQDFPLLGGGNNVVRVMVSAEGKPTACSVHWPSLDARKNERLCAGIMQNGKFEPALDASGAPMASYWMVEPIFGLMRPFGR